MFRLLRYLNNYRKQTILGPIFKMLEAFFELLVPIVMAKIIDVGIANQDKSYIYKMGGVLVLLAVVGYLSSVTCQYFASYTSQGFGTELRNACFPHILEFSHKDIDTMGAPSLITRLSNDIIQLQLAVAMFIRLAFRTPFIIVGATICAFYIDVKLSLLFLLMTPILALCIYFIIRLSTPIYKSIQQRLDHISLIFRENLTGIRVIRAFSRKNDEISRFNHEVEEQKDDSLRVGKIAALSNPMTFMILNFAIVLLLYQSGNRVNIGNLSQGQVLALVNYMNQILQALLALSMILSVFNKAIVSGKRVQEILDYPIKLTDSQNQLQTKTNSNEIITFDHVSFKYQETSKKYILNDINLTIEKGNTIGIIGGTGSGKSTLIQLIPRFYDIQEGRILINGIDVKEYRFDQLREIIRFVPQHAALFSGTIRENMAWGKANPSDEEIYHALEIAQAKEFVDLLPKRLEHEVAQAGKNFSGGQRQRLTIARALISKPDILILDDSASALDFATDAKLRRALATKLKETTVIIVSQRASAIKHCDMIITLDKGEIVGKGSHQKLFNECKIYREICLSQLNEEEAM